MNKLEQPCAETGAAVSGCEALTVETAAIRIGEAVFTLPRPNRHHNVMWWLSTLGIRSGQMHDQGFVLSDGTYASRRRAYGVAENAGQLLGEPPVLGTLFSEDLWDGGAKLPSIAQIQALAVSPPPPSSHDGLRIGEGSSQSQPCADKGPQPCSPEPQHSDGTGWIDGLRFSRHAGEVYRHVKRGSTYTLPFGRAEALVECAEPIEEGDLLTIYIGDDGLIWARPTHEFFDGRFALIPATPSVSVLAAKPTDSAPAPDAPPPPNLEAGRNTEAGGDLALALSALLSWTGQFHNRDLVQWLIAKRSPGFEQLTEDEWVERLDEDERAGWSALSKATGGAA